MRPVTCRNFTAVRLLAALWLLGGCALPKGKVSNDQQAADGGPRDSGAQRDDAATAGKAPRASGSGGAGGRAAGSGAVSMAVATEEAAPKANGASCKASAECASENCKKGAKGDSRCYGAVAPGRECTGEFDCDGYACVPRRYGEIQGVCIDTSRCAPGICQRSYALTYCQLNETCSKSPTDFVDCYQDKCADDDDSDAGCAEELVVLQHLNELGCCPPNGVATGSCGTSPQCGCEDGQKCDSLRDGRTACGPIGEACITDAECLQGFTCRAGVCKGYCSGPDDDSCGKGACVSAEPNGQVEPGIFICVEGCDPTAPTTASDKYVACGANQGCAPASDGNAGCYTTMGSGTQGDPCPNEPDGTYIPKCAPGYTCLVGTDTCARLCKVQDDACNVGTCQSFGPSKSFAGDVEIGYCQ